MPHVFRTSYLSWVVVFLAFFTDLVTKAWARSHVGSEAVTSFVPGLVWTKLSFNPYGLQRAFSFLPETLRTLVLVVAPIALLTWLGVTLMSSKQSHWTRLATALCIGGGAGNLYERILSSQGVTDFLMAGIGQPWMPFGIFNVADVFICLGVLMLLSGGLTAKKGGGN